MMLSVKQGSIKYHFLNIWYDSAWDWTQVSRAIGDQCNHHANVRYFQYFYIIDKKNNYTQPIITITYPGDLRRLVVTQPPNADVKVSEAVASL